MKLSIVIVNWNTRRYLEACLASIYRYPPRTAFEVLVVDNHSSDGSVEMVQSRFPQAVLIACGRNLGFSGGNNLGIRQARGENILLLNPDTEVLPGALDHLLHFLDSEPQAGAAGSRLLNSDRTLQLSCSPTPTLVREFARLFHLPGIRPDGYYAMQDWDLTQPRSVDVLLGACILIRRGVLDQIGLLDEEYFMYSEETDLCLRVQRAGWKLYWVPQAEIIHHGGQSARQAPKEMFYHLYRSKVLFFRKHYSLLTVFLYKLMLFSASLGRFMAVPLVVFKDASRRQEYLQLCSNYGYLLSALPRL